uniref:Metallothionein-like protein n=1 Tax=Fragaria ananassa TaxID=3747 RepID=Q5I2D8_FRAAN|nr:metallothionein-like protein [Fragaria x ananassa]
MSGKCDSCDCSDVSQCTKKGNSLVIVETEKSYDTVVMDAAAAENGGKCKCGTTCSCIDCKCGN